MMKRFFLTLVVISLGALLACNGPAEPVDPEPEETTLEGVIAPRRISVSPGALDGDGTSLDRLNTLAHQAGLQLAPRQGVQAELMARLLDLHGAQDSLLAGQQVVAVGDGGEVVASGVIHEDGSFSFNVPTDKTIALIVARDNDNTLLCGDVLGYQELDGKRTTDWMEAFLRFELGEAYTQSGVNAGTFNFNELNALPASDITDAPAALVMDGPTGAFEDCGEELERVTLSADFDWETPAGFAEEDIYDFGLVLAFGIEEGDRDTLTLLGAGPIDDDGGAALRFSKRPGEGQRVLLVLADVGIFDQGKIEYPLTPAAIIEFEGQESIVMDEDFDFGNVGGGMVLVEGMVQRDDDGSTVPNADVFAFLEDEKGFAFNVATADANGNFSMLLPANQEAGYFIIATDPRDGWTGSACEAACDMPTVERQERTITVRDPNLVELFVEKSVEGSGVVTSNPSGIDCGDSCQADFELGSEVVLTATPDEGSVFVGWEGCDGEDGNECTVTMNESRVVMANFDVHDVSEAEVRRVGFVNMVESAPEESQSPGSQDVNNATVVGVGWFLELEEDAPAAFLDDPFMAESPVCVVDSVTQDPSLPEPPEVPSDFSFLDVGEALEVLVDGGSYTQLNRQEFEVQDSLFLFYITESAADNGNEPPAPLPASGLTLALPGTNDFPAFMDTSFPEADPFELIFPTPTDARAITVDSEFEWTPSASDDAFVELRAEDGLTFVSCRVPDTGVFTFPEETKTELDSEGFSVGYLSEVSRTMFVAEQQDDVVLFLSVTREVTYVVP